MSDPVSALAAALRDYASRWPGEAATAQAFIDFMHSDPAVFESHHQVGHLTGSAWLVSADGQRVLLTHHRKLGRWLQLGGHADGDADLARVALREAEEESGLPGLVLETAQVFDLDRHWIPARGERQGHWHYDVRYLVRATADEAFEVSEESLALAWKPVREIAEDAGSDASMRRMADKWLGRA